MRRDDLIKSARILLIEKDKTLAVKIAVALEEVGYQVATANDALDGLKKLYEAYPDLVIDRIPELLDHVEATGDDA